MAGQNEQPTTVMKRTILTLLLLLGTFAARAQLRLTLDDALRLALSENPTIRMAEMEVERYDYVKRQTWGALLPQVSVSGQLNHNFIVQQMSKGFSLGNDPYTTVSGAVDASLPLFAPQVYRMLRLNAAQMASAVEAARASRIDLVAEVKKAFYNILLAEQSLAVLHESEATVRRDFERLDAQGFVVRVRSGATRVNGAVPGIDSRGGRDRGGGRAGRPARRGACRHRRPDLRPRGEQRPAAARTAGGDAPSCGGGGVSFQPSDRAVDTRRLGAPPGRGGRGPGTGGPRRRSPLPGRPDPRRKRPDDA